MLPAMLTPEEGGGAPKRARRPTGSALSQEPDVSVGVGGVLTSGRPWLSGPFGNPMIRLD